MSIHWSIQTYSIGIDMMFRSDFVVVEQMSVLVLITADGFVKGNDVNVSWGPSFPAFDVFHETAIYPLKPLDDTEIMKRRTVVEKSTQTGHPGIIRGKPVNQIKQ